MAVTLHSFAPNTVAESAKVNTNFTNLSNQIRPTFTFTITSTLATGTSKTPVLIVPLTLTIEKAFARVKTAPTGASILIDLNKNGTTIWSTQGNRLSIATGATSGTKSVFNTTSLAEGDVLTLDVDQIGSSAAGADLTVELKCS